MTDPIKKLPFDLIVLIFSLLSTPQLCLLTGVCRDWRIALQLNAILNRVIDLINVKRPLNEEEMMEVLRLLCPLSTHPRNELHLDITKFWYNFFTSTSECSIREAGSSNGRSSLLSTIVLETRGQLNKLVLRADAGDSFARAIVQGWDELTSKMKEVRELQFQIPFSSISLESIAPGEAGKACSLKSELATRSDGSWEVKEFKAFLEKVAFTGAKITHLGICTGSFDSVVQLYKMVLLHKDSLNYLKLKVESSSRPELALQMAVQCQNLSSVVLSFCSDKDIDQTFSSLVMAFPKSASSSKLREFEFDSVGPRIDFSSDSFLNWLGKGLEVFKLSGFFLRIPPEHLQLVFGSNPLLKGIKLNQIEVFSKSDPFVPSSLRLTNLRCLELRSVSGHGLTIFSAAFLPALESLFVQHHPDEDTDSDIGLYAQTFSVLPRCRLSLKSLKVIGFEEWPGNDSSTSFKQVSLTFPNLLD